MSEPAEVSSAAAYAAAEERAVRTTRALILSEAQVLTLRQQVARLEEENFDLRRRLEDATTPDEEEVTHDATPDEGAAPCGEVDTAQGFSD